MSLGAGLASDGKLINQEMTEGATPGMGASKVTLDGSSPPSVGLLDLSCFQVTAPTLAAAAMPTLACAAVLVKNDDGATGASANTDVIWVGGSNLAGASTGIPVRPGESTTIPVANANQIFTLSPTAAQKLSCMAIGG